MAAIARPASTVILVRPAEGGLEVYLCRRHRQASFMGGAYVFPGGRLDDADMDPALAPHLGNAERAVATFPELPEKEAVGLHVAAVRELFEEAGVLLATDETGHPIDTQGNGRLAAHREKLQTGSGGLLALAEETGIRYDLGGLHYCAHWITPEVEPKRFSARFFIAAVPQGQRPVHDAREVFEGRWYRPHEALEAQTAGEIFLAPPTIWNLHDLDDAGSVEEAIARAAARQVTAIEPRVAAHGSALHFILPADPNYADPEAKVPQEEWRRTVLEEGRFTVYRGG